MNVVAIAAVGIAGTLVGNRMPDRMRTSLLSASGVAVIFIGTAGAISGMLSLDGGQLASGHTMLVLASLVLGTFLGELADLLGEPGTPERVFWEQALLHHEL